MVALFLRNANQIADFVKRLRKDAREHKLADIDAKKKDLELSRAQLTFVKDSVKDFEELLGIPAANILAEFLPNDLAKLRAEMSIHNRLKTVAKYEASGKAIVSEPGRELYREREYVEAQRSERHMRAKRKSEFQTDERRFLELPKPQSGDEEHLAPDKSPAADDAQKEGQLDISFDKSSSS